MRPDVSAYANPARIDHRQIVRLALPMTLAHLSTPLLGVADAAVIGRLGQAHLLGAIAAAAVIFDFIFWSFGFLRMGTAGLTAQALGGGDLAEQRATLVRALIVGLGVGIGLICLQPAIAFVGFAALDASPEVTRAARLYFDIRIWSAPFVLINYVVLGAITGRGRTDEALVLQVFVNLINIAFNIILVYGFELGVRGSAIGTLLAEALGAVAGLFVVWRMYGDLRSIDRRLVFDRAQLARMFEVNFDIMIRTAALLFAFAFFAAQSARGGDARLAANSILLNLFLVTAYFLGGFATAAEQLCGQSVGAGDGEGFRKAVRLTTFWCFAFASVASAAALAAGGSFIDFLTTNPDVRAYARDYLVFAALTPLAGALAFEFDGVFIGATWTRDMRNLMLISLALYLACFYVARPYGNTGLWIAFLVFLLARGLTQWRRYLKLSEETFPLAQSEAAEPIASASRG
ncbi:MATE family efflux transporter [Methylocapsa polymorpha]|uniref:MATE family efflux transporter n=1 Tax=Methylocapsa polymorpha TaxID=3080828 RepID=A0ABZ0HPD9_9HYPH|nr:MATE family efflux transporter [Methylocapsa sp. RX1]